VEPFERIRARFLVPWLAIATFASFVPTAFIWPGWLDSPDPSNPLPDSVGALFFAALLVSVPALHARAAQLHARDLYPRFPDDSGRLVSLAIPLVGVAFVCIYAFYAPLSLVAPELVQSWLFESELLVYSNSEPYPLLGNIAGFVALVIAAPVAEEWFFRGLLLQRWARKWGSRTAVVLSSALFAVFHADLIGAFVFAVVMCGLWTARRSLWAPTIVHAGNNAVVWLLAVADTHGALPLELETAADLRAAWWVPVGGALLALPWVRYAWRHYQPISGWKIDYSQSPSRTAAQQGVADGPTPARFN